MHIRNLPAIRPRRPAWNKGRIVGQKRPLLPKHVWAIRVRLEIAENHRDLALFNTAIDSKLRGCDLVCLPLARGRSLHDRMPQAEFVTLPGVGHLPQLEKPGAVLKELTAFI